METASLGAQLWDRVRPSVGAKLELMQAAADALAASQLDDARREQALAAAHKLSGSLGTYGFPEAGEVAAAFERGLAGDAPAASSLQRLLDRIRRLLGPAS